MDRLRNTAMHAANILDLSMGTDLPGHTSASNLPDSRGERPILLAYTGSFPVKFWPSPARLDFFASGGVTASSARALAAV
jgi:hypothetical protein